MKSDEELFGVAKEKINEEFPLSASTIDEEMPDVDSVLRNELDAWRLNETKKIKGSTELSEQEKKLALQLLLHKETKIL